MKKFLCLVLCSFIIMLNFSGCDFKDIDRRIFIVAIGIDEDKSNPELIEMSFKAAVPGNMSETGGSGSGSQENNAKVYTVTGRSISNILRTLKSKTSREPDFSHMRILVYGKEYADGHDISDFQEFFIRRRDFQDMAWVCLGLPSAKEVLSITPSDEKIPGNSFFMKFGQGSDSPYTFRIRSYEFYNDIITPGCTPICPIMESRDKNIIINQTGIFSEGKLALVLNKEETQLLNLLKNRIKFGSLSIARREDGKLTSISIDSGKTKIKVGKAKDGSGITCTIDIRIEGTLEERAGFSGRASNLTPEFEEVLKKQVMALISKLNNSNLDPLRLEMLYWSNTVDFMPTNAWRTDMLPNINFVINPEINIIHTGVIQE